MTHIDESVLAPVRARYGEPSLLRWEGEVTDPELALITYSPGRRHDVTLFVTNGDRLALIRKPHFEQGIWRTPGGGVKVGEDFVEGIVREGFEELGVDDRARALPRAGGGGVSVRRPGGALGDARLLGLDRRRRARAAGHGGDRGGTVGLGGGARRPDPGAATRDRRALWRYRVALHDAALEALSSG